jgi:hypothetical protein
LQPEPGEENRRRIVISADLPDMVEQTIAALAEMPDGVYVHAGHLAVITAGKDPIHWLSPPSLREWMGRAAQYETRETDKDGNVEAKPKAPPESLAKTLCARGFWPGIRPLKRVSLLPPVTLAGRISDKPGYDAASGAYYLGEELINLAEAKFSQKDSSKELSLSETYMSNRTALLEAIRQDMEINV